VTAVTRRPRTIRDIAHLYLSRYSETVDSVSVEGAPALNLFVTAQDASCLSGFHAANLAAAFSRRKARVRLFELSGLLPNAPFYFSYPPSEYLKVPGALEKELHPALDSISITFDSIRLMGDGATAGELRVNLIHLPPAADRDALTGSLSALKDRASPERWMLYLARDESAQDGAFCEMLGVAGAFSVLLRRINGLGPAAHAESRLGSIDRWETAAGDRVPVVTRNPNSSLSREYLSLCESILGRIDFIRRRQGIERTVDWPRAGTAGGRDQRQGRPDAV
jgi:hypothetical protein